NGLIASLILLNLIYLPDAFTRLHKKAPPLETPSGFCKKTLMHQESLQIILADLCFFYGMGYTRFEKNGKA
ncbi:hypothetical protein, partial [Treponema sp. OMZ 805]|uniref:hypothetical protein n=1 Tax=Treponema sp. OMZ 805 TaxID=2726068 RepID=UPI003D93B492